MLQVVATAIGLVVIATGALEVWLSFHADHPIRVRMSQGPLVRSPAMLRWQGIVLFAIGVFIIAEWVVIR
ncbi:MAG TPA: hypothetical protein VEI48_04190 [Candidatus Sulfotelmatobacter sp.]|jgi:hypothetical protein|nr:hypothetical protein [Candidatus Sulfotelmatobacter sp.]